MTEGTISEFHHRKMKGLTNDQRDAFQIEIGKLVNHHKRGIPFEKARREMSNDTRRRKMKSLLNHLIKIEQIIRKLQPYFWHLFSGWKANDDERKAIAGFPEIVMLMHRIVDNSLESETYSITPATSEMPFIITLQAAQLLKKYGIEPTTTVKSAWFALTKYILFHGCERDEKDETIRNYLKLCLKRINI